MNSAARTVLTFVRIFGIAWFTVCATMAGLALARAPESAHPGILFALGAAFGLPGLAVAVVASVARGRYDRARPRRGFEIVGTEDTDA